MSRMALLLPILIALVIGIVVLVGWLIWALTRRSQAQSAQTADQQALKGGPGTSAPQTDAPYYLLGVKRDADAGWEVHVQGIRYPTLAAVPDPQLRAEVELAIRQLGSFLGRVRQPPQANRGEAAAVAPASAARQGVGAGRPQAQTMAEPSSRRPAAPGSDMPVIDFAQEITEIIEELQAQSPALQGHAVNLQSVPGGGITFLVDGHVYSDIGEIPNPELQALIRRATKEWERR